MLTFTLHRYRIISATTDLAKPLTVLKRKFTVGSVARQLTGDGEEGVGDLRDLSGHAEGVVHGERQVEVLGPML